MYRGNCCPRECANIIRNIVLVGHSKVEKYVRTAELPRLTWSCFFSAKITAFGDSKCVQRANETGFNRLFDYTTKIAPRQVFIAAKSSKYLLEFPKISLACSSERFVSKKSLQRNAKRIFGYRESNPALAGASGTESGGC